MNDPLAPIMAWYTIVRDSMRVTSRVLNKEIRQAITDKHIFHYEPKPVSLERLSGANRELDDLVVLSLVATFERTLRDFIMARPACLLASGDPIDDAIHKSILIDVEYWRIADRLLEVFKGSISPTHLGSVKQIVGYRNWVAHGRSSATPPDGNVSPQFAYGQLSRFLMDAGIVDQS
jgi:hypothetical protein